MTRLTNPLEISEYKQRWMREGSHSVQIHSDLRHNALSYCKVQMFRQQWVHRKYTDVYEDTFFFEQLLDAKAFAHHFKEWVNND
jgi:hypothetical protein